jgi:hypothetical protein
MDNDRLRVLLQQVRERVAQGWCQNFYAQDRRGQRSGSEDKKSVCWCLIGAINVTTPLTSERFAIGERLEELCGEQLAIWNDDADRKQQDVLNLIDRALAGLAA